LLDLQQLSLNALDLLHIEIVSKFSTLIASSQFGRFQREESKGKPEGEGEKL